MIAAPGRGCRRSFGRPDWLDARASAPSPTCCGHMSEGDRLFHSWRAGARLPHGVPRRLCADGRAALALFEATGEHAYLDRPSAWLERCRPGFPRRRRRRLLPQPPARRRADRPPEERAMTARPRPPTAPWPKCAARLWHAHRRRPAIATWPRASCAAFAGEMPRNPAGHRHAAPGGHPALPSRSRSWSSATRTTPGFAALFAAAAASRRTRPDPAAAGARRAATAGDPSGRRQAASRRPRRRLCLRRHHLRGAARRAPAAPACERLTRPARGRPEHGRRTMANRISSSSTAARKCWSYESYDVPAPGPGEALVRHDGDRPQLHRRLLPHRPLPGARLPLTPGNGRRRHGRGGRPRRHRSAARPARRLCRRARRRLRRPAGHAGRQAGAAARRHLRRDRRGDDAQGHDRAISAAPDLRRASPATRSCSMPRRAASA